MEDWDIPLVDLTGEMEDWDIADTVKMRGRDCRRRGARDREDHNNNNANSGSKLEQKTGNNKVF